MRKWLKRIGLALAVLVAVLAVLAVVAWNFGTMQAPPKEVQARYVTLLAQGKVQPVKADGLRIGIPGCRCHSNDPVLAVQHRAYSLKQCASCHSR